MSNFSPPKPIGANGPLKSQKPLYKKTWLPLGLVVMSVVGFIGNLLPDSNEPNSSGADVALRALVGKILTIPEKGWSENLKSDIVASDLALQTCKELVKEIRNQTWLISSRISSTEKPSTDPYDSAEYIQKIDWETTKHADAVLGIMRAITDPILTSGSVSIPTVSQFNGFDEDAIIACGLSQDSAALNESAVKLDSRLSAMNSMASNLP